MLTIKYIQMLLSRLRIYQIMYVIIDIIILKLFTQLIKSSNRKIDFVFSPLARNLSIQQSKYEINMLKNFLTLIDLKTLMEIGTGFGGTLYILCHLAHDDALIISIDQEQKLWRIPVYKAFKKKKQKLVMLKGNSHDPLTLGKVKSILGNRKLDFLFIDGDHSYEGVKKDFEMYGPLVKEGGIIAFHDIKLIISGVPKFWNEIKSSFNKNNIIEIIENNNQEWAGIGIILK